MEAVRSPAATSPVRRLSARRVEGLRRAVLGASGHSWRDLPWRATRDPWLVLVSEVMLQQTQAARVVEPYRRFVARFPTADACADAGTAAVVREWAGLGYNRRAVNLHRAARAVAEHHGGRVPAGLAELRALPGVGPYTARAVLAFAFERPIAAVDTNVARLLSRAVVGRPLGRAQAEAVGDRLVPPVDAWRFSQTLFDLGARYCRARGPSCVVCPLRARCRWALDGHPEPDPGRSGARRQGVFAGSDREGRGRLVDALRRGPVRKGALGPAAGWAGDPRRAARVAETLVAEGIAAWRDGALVLA